MLKEYNELDGADHTSEDEQIDEAPELITSRDDFDSMINEFLNDYEILGRKMKVKLEGETATEKLETLRKAMGDERVRIVDGDTEDIEAHDQLQGDEDDREKWDCETILSRSLFRESHWNLISS